MSISDIFLIGLSVIMGIGAVIGIVAFCTLACMMQAAEREGERENAQH